MNTNLGKRFRIGAHAKGCTRSKDWFRKMIKRKKMARRSRRINRAA